MYADVYINIMNILINYCELDSLFYNLECRNRAMSVLQNPQVLSFSFQIVIPSFFPAINMITFCIYLYLYDLLVYF